MVHNYSVNVDLLEQTDSWYFSLDNHDQKEYLFKKHVGLLQRKFKDNQVIHSVELSSKSDAKSMMNYKVSPGIFKDHDRDINFSPGKIIRENALIINTLKQLNLLEWKVIVRAKHNERIIIKINEKEKKTKFTYYSILAKIKLKGHRNFIEIGVGTVLKPKFNLDGLCSRINKIVENHRNCKIHQFHDKIPVVLNAGDGAIIFHELLGHSLEADYIYCHQSPISRQDIGKLIISKNVTLSTHEKNDAFFRGIPCDDEGEVAKSPLLVEKGILRNLISDRIYNSRLNLDNFGHSRVEDFSRVPMPRMFALYLQPGSYHPDELIGSTSYGVYASEFGDGKVYFEKNGFYFNIREAWLIKNGKISDPLGSIMVRGNILEVLNSVEMVANDFRFDKGISYCFKNGQTLNVRVGQPSVKINNLYITREIND